MAAPAYESVATNTATTGVSIVCDKPSGTAEGDLLIAEYGTDGSASHETPDGWSLIDTDMTDQGRRLSLFRKLAGASEPSSYTFERVGTGHVRHTIRISRYSGVDPTSPINTYAVEATSSNVANVVCPSVTTTVDDCLILRCGFRNLQAAGVTFTAPDSTTERSQIQTANNTFDLWSGLATHVVASAGSTGTATWTQSSNNARRVSATIAIAPAAGEPPSANRRRRFIASCSP